MTTETCLKLTVLPTIGVGISVGASALSGYLLNSPLGVDGSAIFGSFLSLIGMPTEKIVEALTGADDKQAPQIAKLMSAAGTFFASAAGSWAITNAIVDSEHSIEYTDSLALAGTSMGLMVEGICFVSSCIIGAKACCKSDTPKAQTSITV